MKPLNQKARAVLDKLIEAFENPEQLVDTITRATLIPNNSPRIKWSPHNRFIVALHGTGDARGYKQWKEVNRYVKKGAKAMYILVPRFKKVEDEDSGNEEQKLVGFIAAPVFRIEDTDGEPLPECDPPQIPKLQTVADELGIPVTYTGAVSERVLGAYSPENNRITLYTHDMGTFYHELSHAFHKRTGKLRDSRSKESKKDNEIVAEISAATLVHLFEGEQVGRQALQYVKSYDSNKSHMFRLLPEIMEVVECAVGLAGKEKAVDRNDVEGKENGRPDQSSTIPSIIHPAPMLQFVKGIE